MNDSEDLQWTAFCYLTGELDTQQRESFEARLDTDQVAREAVARAHELIDCVVSVSDESQVRAVQLTGTAISNGWMQGMMGAAVGAALCMLLFLGGLGWLGLGWSRDNEPSEDAPFAGAVSPDIENLATIWDETREPLDQPLWPDQQADVEVVVMVEETGLPDGEPSAWIQAAVFGLAEDGAEAPGDSESGGTL